MARGTYETVRAGSCCVAKGGQELEEDGRGMSLSVRSQRANDLPGKAVEGLFAQMQLRGRLQRCWSWLGGGSGAGSGWLSTSSALWLCNSAKSAYGCRFMPMFRFLIILTRLVRLLRVFKAA